jgi:choline dehydrogenase-like flavoprotein
MLIDARNLPDGHTIETDVCVVGAGAGGITLAREFAGSPVRVALLESGGFELDPDTQALYDGKNAGLAYYPLDACRLRYFGGTTNGWGGWCTPPQAHDFDARPWVPRSGWPFPKSHLDPFLERAQKICQLGPYNYDPAFWEDAKHPRLPFDQQRLVTVITQFSPPTRFGQVYRDEVTKADNVSVVLYANALEVESNGATIASISAGTLAGKRFRVKARHFVLAMGGIENARLLLLSNHWQKNGLGNDHDLVGRFFADSFVSKAGEVRLSDPAMSLGLYRQHLSKGYPCKAYIQPSPQLQAELKISPVTLSFVPVFEERYEKAVRSDGSNSLYYLLESFKKRTMPDDLGRHVANIIKDVDQVAIAAYKKLRYEETPIEYYELHAGQDCVPNPDSRVVLSDERDVFGQRKVRLDWRLTDLERQSFDRATNYFAREFGRVGLGRVKLDSYDGKQWPPLDHGVVSAGWHHMGTTRMHPDPKQGVVDVNCRVHSTANLYMAGSSVFPTYEGQPTFILTALAVRLADQLKQQLKRG